MVALARVSQALGPDHGPDGRELDSAMFAGVLRLFGALVNLMVAPGRIVQATGIGQSEYAGKRKTTHFAVEFRHDY